MNASSTSSTASCTVQSRSERPMSANIFTRMSRWSSTSRIVKSFGNPSASISSRRNCTQNACMVEMRPRSRSPTSARTRFFISFAARFVNVAHRIDEGGMPRFFTRWQ